MQNKENYYTIEWNGTISKFNNIASDASIDHLTFEGKASILFAQSPEEPENKDQTFSFCGLTATHTLNKSGEYKTCEFNDFSDSPELYMDKKHIVFSIWLHKGEDSAIYYSEADINSTASLKEDNGSYEISATNITMSRDEENTDGDMPDSVKLNLYEVYSLYNLLD